MKQTPIADQDIDGGYVCRPFSHGGEVFVRARRLSRDEVLAIPPDERRMRVKIGDLKLIKRPRQRRHDVGAAPVTKKPPPWNWRAPTERENGEMKAWIKKTLKALREHDARVEYEGMVRSLRQFSEPQMRNVITRMVIAGAKREARYGNLEPLRKRLPGAEEWIRNPPGKRGPRPQRERDERNSRLSQALWAVERIRICFPTSRWPGALVVEIVATHYGLGVEEVAEARRRGGTTGYL